ncbi:protein farnesyltransferase/geranylgeranyltransferase type-1 subunit alpha-like [Macrobrachium nipponense]|uniref:protein farnesyltransferase/geranylgeranyltransferase type-1 subunit alpha-like n=1 Tax=Macrobrachium nipponense TaxID=159736 RepID=UPI0030C81929
MSTEDDMSSFESSDEEFFVGPASSSNGSFVEENLRAVNSSQSSTVTSDGWKPVTKAISVCIYWKGRIFDGELDFVDTLLEEDVRNNSAWNQRHFTITLTTGFTPQIVDREIEYVKNAIPKDIGNESPWSYLKGVVQHYDGYIGNAGNLESWCQEMYDGGQRSRCLLSFMIDMKEDKMEKEQSARETILNEALELCEALATEHDKIREEYWRYMARHFSHCFGA